MNKLPDRTKAVYAVLEQVAELYDELRGGELDTGLRKAAASRIYPSAGRMVATTARVVAARPALFADAACDPVALQEQQEYADAMRLASEVFGDLARQCADAFLLTQAGAVDKAERIIRDIRAGNERIGDDDPEGRQRRDLRAALISQAEAYLRSHLPYRKGGRKVEKAETPETPVTPVTNGQRESAEG